MQPFPRMSQLIPQHKNMILVSAESSKTADFQSYPYRFKRRSHAQENQGYPQLMTSALTSCIHNLYRGQVDTGP